MKLSELSSPDVIKYPQKFPLNAKVKQQSHKNRNVPTYKRALLLGRYTVLKSSETAFPCGRCDQVK